MAKHHFDTRQVHAGASREFLGAAALPIFRSTVYEQQGDVDYHDILYPRLSTLPNHLAAGQVVADLEGAEAGLVTASGMAAISTALLSALAGGGHLLAQQPLYGGTHSFVTADLPGFGSDATFVDARDPASWQDQLRSNTRAFYVETMTNPLLDVVHLRAVADFCREHGLTSIIDNTFATPVVFRPIEHGFDVVVHSATKYLNGHSDVVAGVVVGSEQRVGAIKRLLDHLGGSLDPQACYLLARGVRTLSLRVHRQQATALELARFLEGSDGIEWVRHPGLESHPDHARARELFGGKGAMIAFELQGGGAAAARFVDAVEIAINSPSLGGVETLVTRPAKSTHGGLSTEERAAAGIADGLVRVSVGIEHFDDLRADLTRALEVATRAG